MARSLCLTCLDHEALLPGVLCRSCTAQVRRDLRAVPGWYTELLGKSTTGPEQVAQRGHEPPTVVGDAALDVRLKIRSTMMRWALHLAQQHRIPTPAAGLATRLGAALDATRLAKFAALDATSAETATESLRRMLATSRAAATALADLDRAMSTDNVGVLAQHLDEHLDAILATPDATLLVDELAALVGSAAAVSSPRRTTTMHIGTCPCGGRVTADASTQDAWCRTCGERAHVSWWRTRIKVASEWMCAIDLRTHLLVAYATTVTVDAVRKAGQRGTVASRAAAGRVEYLVADAVRVWCQVA